MWKPSDRSPLRIVQAVCACVFLIGLLSCLSSLQVRAQDIGTMSAKYTVVSQRWLTREELKKFEDVRGYKIAIKVSLRNDSNVSFEYLASSLDGRPLGYRWIRGIGEREWDFMPATRGKAGPPGSELSGIAYEWRTLAPNSSVEGEVLSYSKNNEEFAFSTFVRLVGGEPVEVITSPIRPISKPCSGSVAEPPPGVSLLP